MAFDVDGVHLGIGDLDALGIAVGVDVAGDGEAGIGRGGADQLDDDLMADERLAAPVLMLLVIRRDRRVATLNSPQEEADVNASVAD
jgi:hypothetical protein